MKKAGTWYLPFFSACVILPLARRVGISVLLQLPKLARRVRLPYPAPRQKKPAPFCFPGLRKGRESATSAVSFFLSKPEVSRGTSGLVLKDDFRFCISSGVEQPEPDSAAAEAGSRTLLHVRRSLLRSASPVCVRAGKAPHPQSPSSFPNRRSHGGPPVWFYTTIP